eukprot:6451083-Prymnesium_polylepis.1
MCIRDRSMRSRLGDLKRGLRERFHLAPGCRLKCGTKYLLDDQRSLEAYDVHSGDTLVCQLGLLGGGNLLSKSPVRLEFVDVECCRRPKSPPGQDIRADAPKVPYDFLREETSVPASTQQDKAMARDIESEEAAVLPELSGAAEEAQAGARPTAPSSVEKIDPDDPRAQHDARAHALGISESGAAAVHPELSAAAEEAQAGAQPTAPSSVESIDPDDPRTQRDARVHALGITEHELPDAPLNDCQGWLRSLWGCLSARCIATFMRSRGTQVHGTQVLRAASARCRRPIAVSAA